MRFRSAAHRLRRQLRHHFNLRLLWLFILCLFGTAALLTAELKLRPLVHTYAEGRANYIASKAVNEAVQEELEAYGSVYDQLIFFEKSNSGTILAVKTDSVRINRLKASILDRVADKLQHAGSTQIEVPLGNIINGELFSGRGPKIPIVLQMVNNAAAEFVSEFHQAGINQTRHRLLIETTVNITVLLPAGRAGFAVKNQVNLAETIIVGGVPESYTDIVDTDGSVADMYSDYVG